MFCNEDTILMVRRQIIPLLASFSGIEIPRPIYSSSSQLFIHWLSDPAFVLDGFTARYRASACPFACSGHGQCNETTAMCFCNTGWDGPACNQSMCPRDCGSAEERGLCNSNGLCSCSPGWHGFDCSIPIDSVAAKTSGTLWVRRAGHTTVLWQSLLVTFGGLAYGSIQEEYSDLEIMSTANGAKYRWEYSSADPFVPLSRYWHTAIVYGAQTASGGTMLIFGGAIGEWPQFGNATNELWSLQLDQLRMASSSNHMPSWNRLADGAIKVYGHTATFVHPYMYTIGGLTDTGDFASGATMARFNVESGTWTECNSTGATPGALFGHSAVYFQAIGSIAVFGGKTSGRLTDGLYNGRDRFAYYAPMQSNRLWLYDVQHNTWRIGRSPEGMFAARFLHCAFTLGSLMFVYGGSPFTHNGPYECRTDTVMVYNSSSAVWLPQNNSLSNAVTQLMPSSRVAHKALAVPANVSGSDNQSTIWITGGFDGRPLNGVIGLTLDISAFAPNISTDLPINCADLTDCAACTSFREQVASTPGSNGAMLHSCAWVLAPSNVTGQCMPTRAGSVGPTSAIADPRACHFCGNLPSCSACAGSNNAELISIGIDTVPVSCSWYQVFPFRNRFCTPNTSVLQNVPALRRSPEQCPIPCSARTNCSSCRWMDGCMWCDGSQECMSDDMFMIRASLGQCYRWQNDMMCPEPCSSAITCAECLARPECGWCESGLAGSGRGSCQRGNAMGPINSENSTCDRQNSTMLRTSLLQSRSDNWSFFSCPNIDECRFPREAIVSCDERINCLAIINSTNLGCSEIATCTDISVELLPGQQYSPSFNCTCPQQYRGNGVNCVPVCDMYGCDPLRGRCTAPNVCTCSLGWTGFNCSIECGCNQHCNCGDNPRICYNNTMGPYCDQCTTGFYGNPQNGGSCSLCEDTCNGNSDDCFLETNNASTLLQCRNCGNHTTGRLCNQCLPGFALEEAAVIGVVRCYSVILAVELSSQQGPSASSQASNIGLQAVPNINPDWNEVSQNAISLDLHQTNGFSSGVVIERRPQSAQAGHDLILVIGRRSIAIHVTAIAIEVDSSIRLVLDRFVPAGDIVYITFSCANINFFVENLQVRFDSIASPVTFQFSIIRSHLRNIQCAACKNCHQPCTIGHYLAMAPSQYMCTRCQCNGHGDVCDVISGGYCGVRANGCTGLSPSNCSCAHFTRSSNVSCATCQCDLCNASEVQTQYPPNTNEDRITEAQLPCYRLLTLSQSQTGVIGSGLSNHYSMRVLRYTNLAVRLVFDVGYGSGNIYVTQSYDFVPNITGSPHLQSSVIAYRSLPSFSRAVIDIQGSDFNPYSPRFYVHIRSETRMQYSLYGNQYVTRLDLFVFFTTFIAAFFLCIMSVAVVNKGMKAWAMRRARLQELLELEVMAQRPNARIVVLLQKNDGNLSGIFDSKMLPVAWQPFRHTSNPVVAATSFLVNGPNARYMLGVGAVRLPANLVNRRRRLRRTSQSGAITETTF